MQRAPFYQLLGAVGRHGEGKCSQRVAFKGAEAGCRSSKLRSEGDTVIFVKCILGGGWAAPAGRALGLAARRPLRLGHLKQAVEVKSLDLKEIH